MTPLPIVKPRECIRALEKVGFYVDHQHGSHIIMRRDGSKAQVVVPNHSELRRGTLRAIIREAGLTVDEFVELLR